MKKFLLFSLLAVIFIPTTLAQTEGRDTKLRRVPPRDRYQIIIGAGPTAFMGDLGGGAQSAYDRNFWSQSFQDIDVGSTRWALSLGARYKFKILQHRLSARLNFTGGQIYGHDKQSSEINRQNRNLHFRSILLEASLTGEVLIIKPKAKQYLFRRERFRDRFELYLFGGVAIFHFNPKAKADWDGGDGEWHALQPLATEGQGLTYVFNGEEITVEDPYKRYSFSFPFGVGAAFQLNKKYRIGLEFGARYTLTDYIDDSHDRYFNYAQHTNGAMSADQELAFQFGDRSLPSTPRQKMWVTDASGQIIQGSEVPTEQFEDYKYVSGQKYRGNPENNDYYFTTMVTLTRIIDPKRDLPKFFGTRSIKSSKNGRKFDYLK